ncbi:Nuclear transport factor 2 [Leucoagaricus sp. SymC.cos]|nr:Nuclear transport factor 2 [Leucoagaricus sp. SymC.cos]
MANFQAIAKQFTDYYYQLFDSNRSGLSPLYRDQSMLTWEGTQILGTKSILEKITELPFQKVQHKVTSMDAQPSNSTSGILVFITGLLVVDDSPNPLQFSQTFQLLSEGGNYYVYVQGSARRAGADYLQFTGKTISSASTMANYLITSLSRIPRPSSL